MTKEKLRRNAKVALLVSKILDAISIGCMIVFCFAVLSDVLAFTKVLIIIGCCATGFFYFNIGAHKITRQLYRKGWIKKSQVIDCALTKFK